MNQVLEVQIFCNGCRKSIKKEGYCQFCKKYFDEFVDPSILSEAKYIACLEHIIYLLGKYQQLYYHDISGMSPYGWDLHHIVLNDLLHAGIIIKVIPKYYLMDSAFRMSNE